MKLHGIIYIVVGIFISFMSNSFKNSNLRIFFYVGLLFIIVGAVKIIINYFSREPKKTSEPKSTHHKHTSTKTSQHQTNKHFVKYCSKCHHSARLTANFCENCGNTYFYRKS